MRVDNYYCRLFWINHLFFCYWRKLLRLPKLQLGAQNQMLRAGLRYPLKKISHTSFWFGLSLNWRFALLNPSFILLREESLPENCNRISISTTFQKLNVETYKQTHRLTVLYRRIHEIKGMKRLLNEKLLNELAFKWIIGVVLNQLNFKAIIQQCMLFIATPFYNWLHLYQFA